MKAIILAAGKGTRLNPLTKYRPKHLLPIAGKTLLERIIIELKKAGVEEIGLIVGYMKDEIQRMIGDGSKYNVKISYIVQEAQLGTAHAIKMAEKYVDNERFIVVYGDITVNSEIILKAINRHEEAKAATTIISTEVEDPWNYGVLDVDQEGMLVNIVEKPERGMEPSRQINAGIYVMEGGKIFNAINRTNISKRGEYEITDTFKELIKSGEKIAVCKIPGKWWKDVGRPWDLLEANEEEMSKIEYNGKVLIGLGSVIGDGCIINPPVIIGAECKIGCNSIIGPYTYIGDHIEVGFGSKILGSIVMDNTVIMNDVEIGYSIIASNCIIEGDVKLEYEAKDGGKVKMRIKGVDVDTGRDRMGSVVGDYSFIGCGSIIAPGTTIHPNSIIPRRRLIYFDVDGIL